MRFRVSHGEMSQKLCVVLLPLNLIGRSFSTAVITSTLPTLLSHSRSYRSGFFLFSTSFRITSPWFFHFSKSLIRLSFSSLKPDGGAISSRSPFGGSPPLQGSGDPLTGNTLIFFFASLGVIRIRMLLQRLLYQYTLLPMTRRTFVHRNKENKYQLGFVPIFNKNVTIASQVPCTLVSPSSTSLLPGTCPCTIPWTEYLRAFSMSQLTTVCAALSLMRSEA